MSYVYLIGGATGIGTSRIALGLAMEEDIKVKSVIGTDSLRAALRKVIGRGVCPPLFYSSFDGDLGAEEGWIPFNDDIDMVIAAYEEQARLICTAVTGVIERAWREELNIIIEGVHISPRQMDNMLDGELRERVIQVVIDIEDEELHRQRLLERKSRSRRRKYVRHLKNFADVRRLRKHIIEQAKEHDVAIIQNDRPSEEVVSEVKEYLFASMPTNGKRLKK